MPPETLDSTVFATPHRGDPHAAYSPPVFPAPQQHPFKDNVAALHGEMGAVKQMLQEAEAAVRSPADRQTLQQGGAAFDEQIAAVDAMVTG